MVKTGMITQAQVNDLSKTEKLAVMELLWESLSSDCDETPDWHLNQLNETQERYNRGELEKFSWEEVKAKLF